MVVIGIDPGTRCGWCVLGDDGQVSSGTWNLKPSRFEGAGMRFVRLRKYLDELIRAAHPDQLACEEVRRHLGVDAAHIYGGILAILQEQCEIYRIPYQGIPVGTVKKRATGKGNAQKDVMIAAAKAKWPDFNGDDNEADARWIALCALEGM